MNVYQLQSYHFDLPEELIAQKPVEPRDHSRLMIVDRKSGNLSEMLFRDFKEMLSPNDRLIFNNTKVIPARLIGRKETGARIEVLLSKEREKGDVWEVMARPSKKLSIGASIVFSDTLYGRVLDRLTEGLLLIKFYSQQSFKEELYKVGQLPLPHYIKRDQATQADVKNYQTVFAKQEGAVAAPTAGLHFTKKMIDELILKGIDLCELTLHVGLGTFKPVQAEDIRQHFMHKETVEINKELAIKLNQGCKGREIAIGTTSCRALESAAYSGHVKAGRFETGLFIYPGYEFKFVKSLLTNFHLPGSSLLMLVSAFGGFELVAEAYKKAVKERFRFFSYGDAMLIL
ncbi:S-adenosylmethionine:tRNA ribosyltransferase-isomerase [Chlamydiales bacterium STE3]|nr:S-adenosylmethionine:tRNA ribosyltransferase-isomerase [Chlamydiales bacterium STE3]